ncbi:MAG: alkaline phosphatase family protein, partial [Gordonia sp. (in: high G+C Gram-positive bacteria)]|uniref:alkaline phosphatase family protein n=1 Tax=Gordonia sp. (in: high G+C Gram-positive bacteria) TaxID=84139 RepID=UPI003BB53457
MGPLDDITPDMWTGPTLADALPAATTALGYGEGQRLAIGRSHTVVLLLVDGLGDVLLHEHSDAAPTLAAHRTGAMRAGFPSTTATSLTSLGTGLCSGEHGVLGYSLAPRDLDPGHTLYTLGWSLDSARGVDGSGLFPPTGVQPMPSMFDEMTRAGVDVICVGPGVYRNTPLTRVVYGSPVDHRAAARPDEVLAEIQQILAEGDRGPRLVYGYIPQLDAAGHGHGPGSPQWRTVLRTVDNLVHSLCEALPPGATLLVTGDHGMLHAGHRHDLDATPALTAGVQMIAGEARVRHLFTAPDAAADVLARWRAEL